jgi:hypothetical protein
MGHKPDLSDLGAPKSVNRVRHLRLGVGEKITAPNGRESRIEWGFLPETPVAKAEQFAMRKMAETRGQSND